MRAFSMSHKLYGFEDDLVESVFDVLCELGGDGRREVGDAYGLADICYGGCGPKRHDCVLSKFARYVCICNWT